MIAAGEAGGILDTILKRLATYIEKNVKLKAQVKGAMVYPVSVIGIAAIVIARHPVEGHPDLRRDVRRAQRRAAAADAHRDRALATGSCACCRSSSSAACCWLIAFKRYYATYGGRRVVDRVLLKAPIFGVLMQKIAVARFCRTLSTLISSGVPILDGLEITARTAGNAIVEDAIMMVRKGGRERAHRRPAAEGDGRLPADGRADDRRRRADGRPRRDAQQDRRLLRGGGRPGGGQPADADGADHDPRSSGVIVGGIIIAMYLPLFDLISKLS